VTELSDGVIDALIDNFSRLPTPMCQIVLEHFHGKSTRVPIGDTAYAMRDSGYNVLIVAQWTDPKDDERCMKWAREAYASLTPYMSARRYMNYLNDDEMKQGDALTAVYGPNLPRLKQIKKRYDPENMFHLNLNITP
jgi:FAD/FMN-containing dehydrogenase